ncbi:MAG: hypothetical protein HZB27_06165 [Meiothermus silvanus]|nr:hypothetical protein [Allomeiothermus silvanus]
MKWRLESWNPDYALPQVGFEETPLHEEVKTGIEGSAWEAKRPAWVAPADWPVLYMVDGRQRVDAVVADPQGQRAILATVSAGAVVRDGAGIRLAGKPKVRRVLLHPEGSQVEPIRIGDLVYEPEAARATDLHKLRSKVTEVMRRLEAELAMELCDEGCLVVMDGQLYFTVQPPQHPLLGYTKTLPGLYLPPEEQGLLYQLRAHERTPIFKLPGYGMGRRVDVFSWYVKLPLEPRAPFHGGAGLMRVETPVSEPYQARQLADLSVSLLCAMASSPARDPRAPQNLIAVGALEMFLGRYMGPGEVIRRTIVRTLLG